MKTIDRIYTVIENQKMEIEDKNKEIARLNKLVDELLNENKEYKRVIEKWEKEDREKEMDMNLDKTQKREKIMNVLCRGERPSYANEYAAGLDLKSNEQVYIMPGEIVDIQTLLAVEIPKGHFGMVVARSGLSFKHQVKLINDVGIIDEDYRGDIGIRLINESKEPYLIEIGDRVAQMIIIPYIQPKLVYVDKLDETDRGTKGFGSTGK